MSDYREETSSNLSSSNNNNEDQSAYQDHPSSSIDNSNSSANWNPTTAPPATNNTAANAGSPNPTRIGWPSPSRQLAGLYTEGRVTGYGGHGHREGESNSNPSHSPYINSSHPHPPSHTHPSSLSHSIYSAPSPRTYPPYSASTPRTQSSSIYRERTLSSHSNPSSHHNRSYSISKTNPNDDHHWSSSISNHTQVGLPPPAPTSEQPATEPAATTTATATSSRKRGAKANQDDEDGNANGKGKKSKRKRASMACTRCRGQKLRCDGTHPCTRCKSLGKQDQCHFESPAQQQQSQTGTTATASTSMPSIPASTSASTSTSNSTAIPTSAPVPVSSTAITASPYSPALTPLPSDRRGSHVGSSPRDDRGIWNPLPGSTPIPSAPIPSAPIPSASSTFFPQASVNSGNSSIPASHSVPPPQYFQEMSSLNSRMARIEGLLENMISGRAVASDGNINSKSSGSYGAQQKASTSQLPGTPGTVSSARASSRASASGTTFLPPFSEVVFNPKVFENRELTRSNTPEEERGCSNDKEGNQDPQNKSAASLNQKGLSSGVGNSSDPTDKDKSDDTLSSEVRFEDQEREEGGSSRVSAIKASKKVVSVLGLGGAETAQDPIGHGVVTEERAQELIDFFVEKCLPFVPILDVNSASALKVSTLRQSGGPFLITAILAIASRYRPDPTSSSSSSSSTAASAPPSAPNSPRSTTKLPGELSARSALSVEHAALVLLAETHLGHTLSRKRHSLSDVQAALFLAAFGLRPGGRGCDSWVVTGHAFRLAKRLSIDSTVCEDADRGHVASPAMIRTWLMLCAFDCFPSLGFGRPASPRNNLEACSKTVKEIKEALKSRSSFNGQDSEEASAAGERLSSHADAFVCAQVDLALISRKLLDWVSLSKEQQARTEDLSPPIQDCASPAVQAWTSPEAVWTHWREIAESLDSWERTYDPLLSNDQSVQRIGALLYYYHVKLCLASFALQLSEVVNEETRHSRKEARIERGEEPEEDSSFREDDEFQTAYRNSGREASAAMVRLHLFALDSDEAGGSTRSLEIPSSPFAPSPLAFTPDYLLVALAQSAIAFTRLSSSSSSSSSTSASDPATDLIELKETKMISEQDFTHRLNPILLLRAADKVFAFLDSPRTGISVFLRSKIKDALLALEEHQEIGGVEKVSVLRQPSRRGSRTGLGYEFQNWKPSGDGPNLLLTDPFSSSMIETSNRAARSAALESWELEMPQSNGWNEAVDWEKDIVSMLFGDGPDSGSV